MKSSTLHDLALWATEVRLKDVPAHVREHAINQVLSILAAVHSGYASDLGLRIQAAFPCAGAAGSRALPAGVHTSPAHAAFLMATWSMVLDFDDVMLGGHTGHSSVLVPLAFCAAEGRSGSDLLLAQIVANEIAARLNMAVALGPIRGQMATHLHLAGATAARATLERLDGDSFAQALAFALSYPAKALYPAFLGSDAKVLCASWPMRMGIESVDAVRAGLRGNTAIVDGEGGFLETFSEAPVPDFLSGLGKRWHTATNSYKIYPGSGYIDAAIDATLSLVRRHDIQPGDVQAIEVFASLFTAGMEAHSAPFVQGPHSAVAALTFSAAYCVACAVLDRSLKPEHLKRERIQDPRIWSLVRRIRVIHDAALTIEALTADIPIGAALKRCGLWTAWKFLLRTGVKIPNNRFSPAFLISHLRIAAAVAARAGKRERMDLTHASKRLGARVRIKTSDSRCFEETVHVPIGFAGNGDWRTSRLLMREKFMNCAVENVGTERARQAAELIESLDQLQAGDVQRLIELNCVR